MKKVLLLSLSLVLGFSAFAQQRAQVRVAKNDIREGVAYGQKATFGKDMAAEASTYVPTVAKSVVVNRWNDMEDTETMETTYDLQSNQFVANRMVQWADGSVAIVATMSHEDNLSASDRGTGYNYYDGSSFADQPEARIEPWKTGWPSLAQWGDNGEIILAHGNGHMQCFTRETAGEGEWQYMGALPDYPEGYPYPTNYPTWPRIVTCGEHHNVIIAIATLQQSVSSDETDTRTIMWRSEDAQNWTVSYSLLEPMGYETGYFSADDYCMAANGNTVAIVYSGNLVNSVWMFKSEDCGLTWATTKVWEHPLEGHQLDEEGLAYEDTLFMPMNSAVVVDNNGVVHVAMNTFEMAHWADTQAGYYNYFYGRAVDGILYWNDTQDAPIADTYHEEYVGTVYEEHYANPNPYHAARLWWPIADNPGYVHMNADTTKWIGYVPMYYDENGSLISWDNDKLYNDNYHSKMYGTSAHPALSCDPYNNLVCAFSSPCTRRVNQLGGADYYCRSIYLSYYNVDEGYWHQVEDDLTDDEVNFMYMLTDNLFTISALNTVNAGEFWFGFQSDDEIGFAWGTDPSQAATSTNVIHACKVIAPEEFTSVPENNNAQDVIYNIYPNPATNYMVVSSAMDTDATITIFNIVGQTVSQFNKHLGTGENTISIDLKSGVYFCTISANGFDKTVKVVVK